MNATACAQSNEYLKDSRIELDKHRENVKRLQMRIVKAQKQTAPV